MVVFDPNMSRWIMASCRVWFETNKLNNVPIFYEYTRHKNITQNNTVVPASQYAELRLDGPYYRQITANEAWYNVDINVLCTQDLKEGQADLIESLISSIYVCFPICIPVYRYGDPLANVLNDSSFIDGMRRTDERDGEVNVQRFGQANPDTLLSQVSIEAGYRLKLFL